MSWQLNHRNSEVYIGEFSSLTRTDLSQLRKSDGWSRGLNWNIYLQKNHEYTAYKLRIIGNDTIQGLIAVAFEKDM